MIEIVNKRTINRGLKNWSKNCLRFYFQRFISRIKKRDPKLWVLSAWEGNKYSDNSKYLYEYLCSQRKDIICYWITKNENIYKELKSKNQNVCIIGTKKCDEIESNAGVAIYTHGLDDFGDFPLVFGAKLVCLWHSAPVIKLNYATRKRHDNALLDCLVDIKSIIFSYIYRDLTIATSKIASDNFIKESLTKKPVVIIGQPRNDIFGNNQILYKNVLSDSLIKKLKINKKTRFITYMPTYRPSVDGQKKLENQIVELINDDKLNKFLKDNNLVLFMKMHYLTDIKRMTFNDNIVLLSDADVDDVQKLLKITNMLITDYSSCCIDFALTNREILFWTPDLYQYASENGLYDVYRIFLEKNSIIETNDLIESIKNAFSRDFISSGVSQEINNLYNENVRYVGCFSEKVAEEIVRRFVD